MSAIALRLGPTTHRGTLMPRVRAWHRFPLKRIFQFTLLAVVIVPIPSDDGPIHPPTAISATVAAKTIVAGKPFPLLPREGQK